MLLGKRHMQHLVFGKADRNCTMVEKSQQVSGPLESRPSPQAKNVLVKHAFFACGKPGHVESEPGIPLIKIVETISLEDAQHQWGQRLDRVLQLSAHRSL